MAGLKFTKHSYQVQANKRMKQDNGVGFALRNLVSLENMLVMNDAQFRYFYEKFSGHQLIGGEEEDLNCLKLSILKEMVMEIYAKIDIRGFWHEQKEEDTVEQSTIQ